VRDGYVVVKDLVPRDIVEPLRDRLCAARRIDRNEPTTWANYYEDLDVVAETKAARTPAMDAVTAELVGPDFLRGQSFSPYLASIRQPPMYDGFLPLFRFPTAGEKRLTASGFHIDGSIPEVDRGEYLSTYPGRYFLAVVVYLTDAGPYSGTTLVRPGSHRQIFEKWVVEGRQPGGTFSELLPALPYADPVPVVARAGDVCFLHYLTVHSGSINYDNTVRMALNSAVTPDPERPYRPRSGPPAPDWTLMDYTLRVDVAVTSASGPTPPHRPAASR
jgi:hypothetical protein